MLRDNLVELIEPMLNSAGADPLALYIHTRTPASDDRLPCLKNPRPEGAESSLTESASSPFQAEPAHHEQRVVDIELEKTLRVKVGKQTFPLRLGIPQKTRDSHFPTAATTTALRLHFKWRDDPPHGYILKWLDAPRPAPGIAYSHRILRKPFDKWHPRAHPPSGSKLRRLPGRLRARRGNGRFRALAQGILNRPIWL